jgi:hypothetical protein
VAFFFFDEILSSRRSLCFTLSILQKGGVKCWGVETSKMFFFGMCVLRMHLQVMRGGGVDAPVAELV